MIRNRVNLCHVLVVFVFISGLSSKAADNKAESSTHSKSNGKRVPPGLLNGKFDVPGSELIDKYWLTTADRAALFQKRDWKSDPQIKLGLEAGDPNMPLSAKGAPLPLIHIEPQKKYQSVDGFGFTLTGGGADLISKMSAKDQEALLNELFLNTGSSIRINYLRVSMGASDLSASVFTYNDQVDPVTGDDPDLKNFSMGKDLESVVPVLKKVIKMNPEIKILASPWTAPAWMKNNKSFIAGTLEPRYYSTYAQYFIKYITAMKAEGIVIDAVTLQNEPHNAKNNPSMIMNAKEAGNFVKNHLGPALQRAGLKTKIIIWDHNCDEPNYPLSILADPEAFSYVDGSAFHLYAGNPSALSKVHDAYPSKNVYLTEQWVGGPSNFKEDLFWHLKIMLISTLRNWSRTVLEWNLASDPQYGPHTPLGGCRNCLGALTINPASESSTVVRNVAYYVIAHASKFVDAGSWRIESNSSLETLSNVAFQSIDGRKTLIVLNEKDVGQDFRVDYQGKQRSAFLPAKSVGTFVWQAF